ncbi:hypothetical protein DSO57_1002021 [Entomophthora muscae]|uniref:Uncharacterized protein n=1 Tax=Entomophthora muscae TaxID=34485 RepID=A0ACC2SAZ4_9FUNG|nr:hypothetical protein DSO57_1002021 [Entomophthora muscae]
MFDSCALLFKKPETRLAISDILLEYVSEKSSYASEIKNSTLQEDLFWALLFDEEPRILHSSSILLTMLLPYLLLENPGVLPVTLAIFVRLSTSFTSGINKLKKLKPIESKWSSLKCTGENKLPSIPDQLFTFLYGMYPRSLVLFLRSPVEYLQKVQSFAKEGWYSELLNNLDLSFIENSSVYNLGKDLLSTYKVIPELLLEDLKLDAYEKSPLESLEPSDVISLCLEKRVELFKEDSKEHSLENAPYKSIVQRLTQIHLEIEASSTGLPNPAQSLNTEEKCLLLHAIRSELYLERFLRRHQSDYIRRFHREQLTESSSEAERHSLYSTCRALRQEVKLLKELQERQKLEGNASQSKHIKWENELNQKLKYYRELSRDLKAQNSLLQSELQLSKDTVAQKEEIAQKTQAELSSLQYQMETLDLLSSQLKEKERQNEELSSALLNWDFQKEEIAQLKEKVSQLGL